MTWVVGANSLFGMAFLISDIQITFSNGTTTQYVDCCQKIHPLSQHVVGGFAGSVKIGFDMIDRLKHELRIPSPAHSWDLELIANDWLPEFLREVFNGHDEHEKNLGCQILLAAASPDRNRGAMPLPWTEVIKFSWPNFEPEFADQTGAISIGSGSSRELYVEYINRVTAYENESYHQMAVGNTQNQGRFIAQSLSDLTNQNPTPGISRIFQVLDVTRGPINLCNHEYDIYHQNGQTVQIRFPNFVAQNYRDFLQFCGQVTLDAEGAIG